MAPARIEKRDFMTDISSVLIRKGVVRLSEGWRIEVVLIDYRENER